MAEYYGGIEAGGTKFICAIGTADHEIVEQVRIPTGSPEETIEKALSFFREHKESYPLSAIGIGSFGPVDFDKNSPTYGYVTSTPKPGWQNTNFGKYVSEQLHVPLGFDTDVNAAVMAENLWGVAKGLDTVIYLTFGTGIGGGAMVNGKLLHGLSHPEMGHSFIPRAKGDAYQGSCPYHRNRCFEGLACGPAIKERWGVPGEKLPKDHEAWKLEAHYIALGLSNFITILSPQKIMLGGSVMQQEQLFPLIRKEVRELLNIYINLPSLTEKIDDYIVPAGFGDNTGILGTLALAINASSL